MGGGDRYICERGHASGASMCVRAHMLASSGASICNRAHMLASSGASIRAHMLASSRC